MEEEVVEEFLAHYGIPGMRWGKRTKSSASANTTQGELPPRAVGYTDKMQKNDFRRVGKQKGIEKVHQKVADGTPLKKAREQVATERYNRNAKITTGVLAGAYVASIIGPTLKEMGGIALDQAVVRKKASNGKKHAATLFSDSHGIANYDTIRMHQNPTTGNWV